MSTRRGPGPGGIATGRVGVQEESYDGAADPPALEPIAFALSFYRLVSDLALARGLDPDRPPHLAKITETI